MPPQPKRLSSKTWFSILLALAIVAVSLVLTAAAAPAVAERFVAEPETSTADLDRKLFAIRDARMWRLAEEARERAEIERKEELVTRRGLSRATIADRVPPSGKFIGVDLVEMTLMMYENGALIATTSVLSKGRPGSHWETPSGSYVVRTKEELHFSSIGHVYMPWSMQFFGNFFIHGWPIEPSGAPVPEGYSGGCIRLSTEDAEKVFHFAAAGTPIFIYDTDAIPDEPTEPLLLTDVPLPTLTAAAFAVADLDAGEILLERNAGAIVPIASITKLMTAIIANELIAYDKYITLPPAPEGEDAGGARFPEDERMIIGDLYYPLLNESSNQVALGFGNYLGEKRFVAQMNEKAAAIGMRHTTFADPVGLDTDNVSTADDLVSLLIHLREKKRFILNITKEAEKLITAQGGAQYQIRNTSPFIGDIRYLGGKTGFTNDAKQTGVFVFRHGEGEDVRAIAFIVLGSDDRKADVLALQSWLASATATTTPISE